VAENPPSTYTIDPVIAAPASLAPFGDLTLDPGEIWPAA